MKKSTVQSNNLQLRKNKIANLTQEQMVGINGGTMPHCPITTSLLVTVAILGVAALIEYTAKGK